MNNSVFNFLPTAASFKNNKKKQILEIIGSSREKLTIADKNYERQSQLLTKIVDKVTPNEYGYAEWSKDDYLKFRSALNSMKDGEIDLVHESIVSGLDVEDSVLIEQLEKVAKNTKWYPEITLNKEPKTNQNMEIRNEIKAIDYYNVALTLVRRMRQHSSIVVKNTYDCDIFGQCDNYQDLENILIQKEYQELYLGKFDEEFSFLKELPTMKSIYENYRANYLYYFIMALCKQWNDRKSIEFTNQQYGITKINNKIKQKKVGKQDEV